jgi:hypothetical protein
MSAGPACKGDLERMGLELLGKLGLSRKVHSRFRQIGLKLREELK